MNPVAPNAHLAYLPIGCLIQANLSVAFLVNASSGPAAFYEFPGSGIVFPFAARGRSSRNNASQ